MAGHVFFLDPHCRGDGFLRGLGVLYRRPAGHLAVAILGNRHGRLHRRMRQHGCVVGGLESLAALGELPIHVAQRAHRFLRLVHGVDELLLERH